MRNQILIVCLFLCAMVCHSQKLVIPFDDGLYDSYVQADAELSLEYLSLLDQLRSTKSSRDSIPILIGLGHEALRLRLKHKRPAFHYLHSAYEIAKRGWDPILLADATLAMSVIYRRTDRYEAYLDFIESAIQMGIEYEDLDPTILPRAYHQLAIYHYKIGDYEEMIKHSIEAEELTKEAGGKELLPDILSYLGYGHFLQGDFQLAISAYLEALETSHEIGKYGSHIHVSLGEVYLAEKSFDRAIEHFLRAQEGFVKEKDIYGEVEVLRFLADAKLRKGHHQEAVDLANQSIELNAVRYKKNYGYAHIVASMGYLELNNHDKALAYAVEGQRMNLTEKEPNKVLVSRTLTQIGRVYRGLKEYQKAIDYISQSLLITTKSGFQEATRDNHLILAEIYEERGNSDQAVVEYKEYMTLNNEIFNATKSRQLENMKVKYDTDKKELENSNLLRENEMVKARNARYIVGGVAMGGLLFLSALFYIKLRRSTQLIQSQNETIRAQMDELEKMDRIKTNFFSNITHEFRTPLTLIIEPVRQLLQSNIAESSRELLRPVGHSAQQLLGLVNQLLDMSKVEAGMMPLDLRLVTISDIIDPLFDTFLRSATSKRIRLTKDIVGISDLHYWDRKKMQKVIGNLLSNAVKFTNKGSVQLNVKTGTSTDQLFSQTTYKDALQSGHKGQSLYITVKDTGEGIKAAELPHVFDRFYQTTNSRDNATAGTGIGLSLVKELVELMGGTIGIESTYGVSTTFIVELPIIHHAITTIEGSRDDLEYEEEEMLQVAITPIVAAIEPLEKNTSLPHALIVEDNDELRRFISQSIQSEFNVIEAADGQNGQEAALKWVPDIIVSDVVMPKMDGITMTDFLKNHELTSHIPIILLTAKSAIKTKIDGLKRGADAYMTKPFNSEELVVRMNALIATRVSLQERYSLCAGNLDFNQNQIDNDEEQLFLQKIYNVIKSELSNPDLSVQYIAEKTYISRSQLFRKIKAVTGQSPKDVIDQYRLSVAHKMIISSNHDLLSIIQSIGYSDAKYFAQKFKQHYGVSPTKLMAGREQEIAI